MLLKAPLNPIRGFTCFRRGWLPVSLDPYVDSQCRNIRWTLKRIWNDVWEWRLSVCFDFVDSYWFGLMLVNFGGCLWILDEVDCLWLGFVSFAWFCLIVVDLDHFAIILLILIDVAWFLLIWVDSNLIVLILDGCCLFEFALVDFNWFGLILDELIYIDALWYMFYSLFGFD